MRQHLEERKTGHEEGQKVEKKGVGGHIHVLALHMMGILLLAIERGK